MRRARTPATAVRHYLVLWALPKQNGGGGGPPPFKLMPQQTACPPPLWRTVGGDQTSLAHGCLAVRLAQAGRLEIGPGLLRAIATDSADVEAVCLCERLGVDASTLGVKPGRTVSAPATRAAMAIAENALIMTVPLKRPFRPVVFVAALVTMTGFAIPSRKEKMVSFPDRVVSSALSGRNKTGFLRHSPRESAMARAACRACLGALLRRIWRSAASRPRFFDANVRSQAPLANLTFASAHPRCGANA